MEKTTMTGFTNQQKKYSHYLSTEAKRQRGSPDEWTTYPQFMIECVGCFQELKTSDPQAAQAFLKDHSGHKTIQETNQHPGGLVFDRETVLEQLVSLGKSLARDMPKDGVVIKNARNTYLFIHNGGSIEGGLKRLMSVFLSTQHGIPMTDYLYRLWLRSIIYQDLRFLKKMEGK